MRTTERTMERATPRVPPAATTGGIWTAMASVYRLVRNRLEFNRLQDLDDYQLLDIGLTRSDVKRAATSTFFEDPFVDLQKSARLRARRMDRSS